MLNAFQVRAKIKELHSPQDRAIEALNSFADGTVRIHLGIEAEELESIYSAINSLANIKVVDNTVSRQLFNEAKEGYQALICWEQSIKLLDCDELHGINDRHRAVALQQLGNMKEFFASKRVPCLDLQRCDGSNTLLRMARL